MEQFVSKVRNGAAAYAATDLPPEAGAHWRQYGDPEAQGEAGIAGDFQHLVLPGEPMKSWSSTASSRGR